MKKILVIKLRYIGDVLLATPVLSALKERYPAAHVTVAVNQGTEDILKRNPDVGEVLVVGRGSGQAQLRFLRDLRQGRFDCAIDLTDGDRSAILARLSGAPCRIGFNDEHRWRGLLYSAVVKAADGPRHRVEHDLQALRPLGIEPKSRPLVLRTAPSDDQAAAELLKTAGLAEGDRLVMLQPGARYWFKAWPAERFARLADRLAEAFGCRILIGGSAQETDLAQRIAALAKSGVVVMAGRAPLLHYAALLKRCALFVGNDNGPMHMAAALDVPVVALFGPSDPAEWGPRGPAARVIYKGLDCRRCFHPTCDRGEESCMKRITVDEVFAAAAALLHPGAGR